MTVYSFFQLYPSLMYRTPPDPCLTAPGQLSKRYGGRGSERGRYMGAHDDVSTMLS